jgi:hypothetical protein
VNKAAYTRLLIAVLVSGCTTSPVLTPPTVPANIQAPAGTVAYLEAFADGVQIYECSRGSDSTYRWALKAPRATLSDRAGAGLGKHYGGPTWEAADGSTVVGEAKAQTPSPTPAAIPWVLLAAKSSSTSGTLSSVKFVHRVATVGGVAPAQGCSESTLKQQVEVPYTATYVFYR